MYLSFATHAGCKFNASHSNFDCLVAQDTATLQAASNAVSSSGDYGTWAFLPVTDDSLIRSRPSEALFSGKLNGLNHLSSNVAEESFMFVRQDIDTSARLETWIRQTFPSLNDADVADIFAHYPQSQSHCTATTASHCSAPRPCLSTRLLSSKPCKGLLASS
jgi:carboxylesterase type B